MTYNDIVELVDKIGLPCAYDHFTEGDSPEPPFVVFLMPGTNNFFADGVTYVPITEVNVELYTDYKNPVLEKLVEDVLDSYELPWDKTEVWIAEERLYEVLYTFETIYEQDEEESEDDSEDDSGEDTDNG